MNGPANFSINKKNNILQKIFVGAAVLLFFIATLNFFSSGIKNAFYFISSPLQKTFWSAGVASSNFLNSFLQAGSLKNENENLKNENQNLLSKIIFLQSITEANQAQTNISSICENNGFNVLMAGVIGLDGQDIITINKGSDSGISEGMPVINQQNVLFGKILNVYKNFSQVMLISNKDSVIDVSINNVYGVIKGKGNLSVYLDFVPIDQEIKEGDTVTTSLLEKIFPKNLLIGSIQKMEKNDQKAFQQAEIKPFFDLKNADNLFVITNYKR